MKVINLDCLVIRIENEILKASDNEWGGSLIFLHDKEFFLWNTAEESLVVEKFKNPLQIPSERIGRAFLNRY